jgi:phytoene desaturase
VVVIGGGVGGLSVATRLADAGHKVTVVERTDDVGGKLAVLRRDGFSFDIGPSLVTLPHEFDSRVRDRLDLRRLDPQFHYHWPDGHSMVIADGQRVDERFAARSKRIWDISTRTFLSGPMGASALRRLRDPRELWAIDALPTLAWRARRNLRDPHLQQWAMRYATYSGSSPYRAPATLACIAHVEAEFGCWYPMGGLGALRDAIRDVAIDTGVTLRTGVAVTAVTTTAERVTGVELAGGDRLDADIVVANCDAEVLYRDLLPDAKALRRVRRAARSTSGVVVCAGVRGRTPGIGHHNVWFSADYRAEFDAFARGRMADDPTIYACVSSVTDDSQAPKDHENWFLLINTPSGVEVDADQETRHVLARLAAHGVDLRDRLLFTETMTPVDMERRYGSLGGAIYGTSSDGRRAAFVRPANRGARRGLYLVGGSSHPGGGLPMVSISARIVAEMIAKDLS